MSFVKLSYSGQQVTCQMCNGDHLKKQCHKRTEGKLFFCGIVIIVLKTVMMRAIVFSCTQTCNWVNPNPLTPSKGATRPNTLKEKMFSSRIQLQRQTKDRLIPPNMVYTFECTCHEYGDIKRCIIIKLVQGSQKQFVFQLECKSHIK